MLSIVGTPIGNLSDLSYRQARAILTADIILAENTGSAGILLQQIPEMFPDLLDEKNPNLRVVGFHKDNEFEKLSEALGFIQADKNVVLISESGMPIISDPGNSLIKQVIKAELPFEVVPGPTAWTTALVYSGFNLVGSVFLGFLPKKPQEKEKLMKSFTSDTVYVAYESPYRVIETLEVLNNVQPNAEVVICRELTKKFEEIIRGKAADLLHRDYKGELTIVLRTAK